MQVPAGCMRGNKAIETGEAYQKRRGQAFY